MMLGFNPVVDNDFVVGQYSLILNSLFWMHWAFLIGVDFFSNTSSLLYNCIDWRGGSYTNLESHKFIGQSSFQPPKRKYNFGYCWDRTQARRLVSLPIGHRVRIVRCTSSTTTPLLFEQAENLGKSNQWERLAMILISTDLGRVL